MIVTVFLEMKRQGQNSQRDQELIDMFREADANGDGEIEWTEFLEMIKMRMRNQKITPKTGKTRKATNNSGIGSKLRSVFSS